MKHLLGLPITCLLASLAGAQTVTLEPDPGMQEAIRAATHASEEAEQVAALDHLRELDEGDHLELVRQLLYYSWKATDTRDGMAMGVLLGVLRVPDASILRALVPLLESSDPDLLKEVGGVLSEFEHETVDRPPSLAAYREFLDAPVRAGSEPPPGLVAYLYRRDAGTALLLLTRVHTVEREELREILWAEHVIDDTLWKQRFGFLPRDRVEDAAREQLELLSAHPRWWARLYAVQLMADHAAFRDPTAVERLARDPHALVRARASALLAGLQAGSGGSIR